MDYKELIEHLERRGLSNPSSYGPHSGLYEQAATAITDLLARAQKAERERDAAVLDLKNGAWCENCAHYADMSECGDLPKCDICRVECYCKDCTDGIKWVWRGVKEE